MASAFEKLREVIAHLRAPDGCPWDREQTNDSLVPKLLEEAYEVAHAIREKDDANLREELGDVLLLVMMQAQIASERAGFGIEQVMEDLTAKLIRRHPHVFGETRAENAGAVVKVWDEVKREEKRATQKHYLTGVAEALPALMRAQKVQKKAAHVHFDWRETGDVIAKVDEEFDETKEAIASGSEEQIAEEIGDLLFAVVNLARKRQLDAETLLQTATDKFVQRFNEMEDEVRAQGKQLGELQLEALDEIWNAQKAARKA